MLTRIVVERRLVDDVDELGLAVQWFLTKRDGIDQLIIEAQHQFQVVLPHHTLVHQFKLTRKQGFSKAVAPRSCVSKGCDGLQVQLLLLQRPVGQQHRIQHILCYCGSDRLIKRFLKTRKMHTFDAEACRHGVTAEFWQHARQSGGDAVEHITDV